MSRSDDCYLLHLFILRISHVVTHIIKINPCYIDNTAPITSDDRVKMRGAKSSEFPERDLAF